MPDMIETPDPRPKPDRFPDDSRAGPWGVSSVGMYWWVIHRETLESQSVGTIGKPAMFARALEEASRRNALPALPAPAAVSPNA